MRGMLFWAVLALLFLILFAMFAWSWVSYYDPVRTAVMICLVAPLVGVVGLNSGTFVKFHKRKRRRKFTKTIKRYAWAVFFVGGGAWALIVLLLLLNQAGTFSPTMLEARLIESDISKRWRPHMRLMFPAYAVTDFRLQGDAKTHRVRHRPASRVIPEEDGSFIVCRATRLLALKYYYLADSEACS